MVSLRWRKAKRQQPAARWLLRLLDEHPSATIEEAALAASSLIGLTGVSHEEAARTLRPKERPADGVNEA